MASLHCPFCGYHLSPTVLGTGSEVVTCGACQRLLHASVFPAFAEANAQKPPLLPDPPAEGEAVCFYNPGRRATTSCKHCGVLISDLWAAQWGSDTVCLKCLDHLRAKGKDERFETGRTLWDNVVLGLAAWPFIPPLTAMYCMMTVTAPAAVFLGLWHWRTPGSLVPRGRWRLVLGLLLALLELGGMVFGGVAIFTQGKFFED